VPAREPERVPEPEPAQVRAPGSATASSASCCCRTAAGFTSPRRNVTIAPIAATTASTTSTGIHIRRFRSIVFAPVTTVGAALIPASSAETNSAAVANRSSGFFCMQRRMISLSHGEIATFSVRGSAGSSRTISVIVSVTVSPRNGSWPVAA